MKKRLISLLLTITMILSLVPTWTVAVDTDSAGDPSGEAALMEESSGASEDGTIDMDADSQETPSVEETDTLSGRVVDAAGQGVSGVSVLVYNCAQKSITAQLYTGSDGSWSLNAADGSYRIRYYHAGDVFAANDLSAAVNGEMTAVDPVTMRPGDIAGLVCKPEDYTFTVSDAGAAITGYTGSDQALLLPSELGGAPVVSIEGSAFQSNNNLTAVVFSDRITAVGNSAFLYCSNLQTVCFNNGLKTIGNSAFYDCDALASIAFPIGLERIEPYAFYDCSLRSVTIPESVVSVGYNSFQNNSTLETAYFLGDAPSFGSSVFSNAASDFGIYFVAGKQNWNTPTHAGYPSDTFRPYEAQNLVESAVSGGALLFDPVSGVIVGYTGAPTALVIPAEIDGAAVKEIAENAFSNCLSITSVSLPEGLSRIGNYAFYQCTALKSVTLPGSLESIGSSVFRGCTLLERVTASEGLTTIGKNMFYGCTALTDVTLPESLQSIESYAFYQTAIKAIPLQEGLTSIGDYAFSNCSMLESVELPDSVTSVGAYAFQSCSKLASAVLSDSMTEIPNGMFYYCAVLEEIRIPNGVERIGNSAFYDCYALKTADIPESVTAIGSNTFGYCSALKTVDIPDSVTSIGDGAFYYSGLTEITIPGSVQTIANSAFYDCGSLERAVLEEGVTSIGSYAFYECSKLADLRLPEGLKTIGQYAFQRCYALKSVTFPASVTNLYSSCFNSCSKLSAAYFLGPAPSLSSPFGSCASNFKLYYVEGQENWTTPTYSGYNTETFIPVSQEGVVEYTVSGGALQFDLSSGTIIGYTGEPTAVSVPAQIEGVAVKSIAASAFSECLTLMSVALPEGLTTLGGSAFYGCAALTSVTLPSTLTTVGSDVFRSCTALESVTLAEGLSVLGKNMFYGCTVLPEIRLPDDITVVPERAFYQCGALASVKLPASLQSIETYALYQTAIPTVDLPEGLTTIGSYAFSNCTMLESVELPSSVTGVGEYAFSSCSKLGSAVLSDSMTEIPNGMFYYCAVLEEIRIPNGVERIGNSAFYNCYALETADIPESVTAIGSNTFGYCSALKTVDIPGSVTSIGDGAFYYSGLTEITIPGSVQTIANSAFYDCGSLERAVLEEGITSIGQYAFYECSKLADLRLPEGLKTIGQYAFQRCYALKSVTFPESLTNLYYNCFYSCSKLSAAYFLGPAPSLSSPFGGCASNFKLYYVEGQENWTTPTYSGYNTETFIPITDDNLVLYDVEGGQLRFDRSSGTIAGYTGEPTAVSVPAQIDGVAVKSIAASAFSECLTLMSVTLPEGLTTLGGSAFYGCTALTSVTLPSTLTTVGSDVFRGCTALESVALAEGLSVLGKNMFYGCTVLPEIQLPDAITVVPERAFYQCKALASVKLPASLQSIETYAFYQTAIPTVDLPEGLTTIGSYAFSNCTMLESVELPSSVTGAGEYAFSSCSKLASAVLSGSMTEIPNGMFSDCRVLEEIRIPNGVERIGNSAFYDCYALKTADIPESVTSIGSNAFGYCSALKTVDIPDSVTSIGDGAFYYSGLTEITIPGSVQTVAPSTFYGCSSLERAVLEEGITSIGQYAFYECSKLADLRLPEGLKTIGQYAFQRCYALKSVTFPESLTNLYSYCFNNCSKLSAAYFLGPAPSLSSPFGGCASNFKLYYVEGQENWTTPTYSGYNTETFIPITDDNLVLYDVEGGQLRFDRSSGTIAGYTGEPTAVSVPAQIEGVAVKSVAASAFSECLTLTSVTLPEGLASLGGSAFYGCTALTSVTLPSTLTTVGSDVFRGCTALESVTLAEGLSVLGKNMFYGCTVLPEIQLPDAITVVPERAFYQCRALASVKLPASLQSIETYAFYQTAIPTIDLPEGLATIGTYAFSNCTKLESVEIPSSVTGVGEYAFSSCSKLGSAVLSDSMTEIPNGMFYYCAVLEEIRIPNGVERIGNSAFYNCYALKTADIPENVTTIGAYAFGYCYALKTVDIPGSVTSIGDGAFYYSGLTEITIPGSVQTIANSAFYGCSSLERVVLEEGVTSVGSYAFYECSKLADLRLPEGLKTIGQYAFQRCYALKSVTFPESVTNLYSYCFNNCSKLSAAYFLGPAPSLSSPFGGCASNFKLYYVEGKARWTTPTYGGYSTEAFVPASTDNVILYAVEGGQLRFDRSSGIVIGYTGEPTAVEIPAEIEGVKVNGVAALAFSECKTLTSVTLPEGLTSIGSSAFYGCTALKRADLPSTLATLGGEAFRGCTALESIALPGALTSVGTNVFRSCTALERISMANDLTVLGDSMFYECKALKSVVFTPGIREIPQNAFSGCSGLTAVSFPEHLERIGDNAFSNCPKLEEVVIPDSVESIGNAAFYNCSNLTSAVLPEGLTVLPDSLFSSCSALPEIQIPDTVQQIGNSAFYGCYALKTIEIPDTVVSIGSYAFYSCGLTEITVPGSVQTISDNAFYYCSSLKTAVLEEGITNVGSSAFGSCSELTDLRLPTGLKTIGGSAFQYCSALRSVTIPDSVTTVSSSAFYGCSKLKSACFLGIAPNSFGGSVFSSCASGFQIRYITGKAYWTTPTWKNYQTVPVTRMGSSVYQIVDSAMTWEAAQQYAAERDSILAEISDADEAAHVSAMLNSSETGFWVGARRADQGSWAWNSGAGCDGSLFSGNLPDSGSFLALSASGSGYGWSSGGQEDQKPFVMETEVHIQAAQPVLADVEYPVEGGTILFAPATGTIVGYSGEPVSVVIPAEIDGTPVQAINVSAFNDCASLESLTAAEDCTVFRSVDGVLYSKDGKTLILCPKAKAGTLAVPTGTETIAANAFYQCTKLSEVTLPDTVKTIGARAFYGCSALEKIDFGSGLETINHSAFRYCGMLGSIVLPDSCSSIGKYAFAHCESLRSVSLPAQLETIPDAAFLYCKSLTSISMPETLTAIGNFAFEYSDGLTAVYFPGEAPEIGSGVFPDSEELTLYYVHGRYGWTTPLWNGYHTEEYRFDPDSPIYYFPIDGGTVKYNAQTGCIVGYAGHPTRAVIPAEVDGTEIVGVLGKAFYGCDTLQKVYLPTSVLEIDEESFLNCAETLKIYGAADSAAQRYAEAQEIPFVPCSIATVSPAAFSTIGGESYTVTVTMSADIDLPLNVTAKAENGDAFAVPHTDSMSVNYNGKTVHTYTLDLTDFSTQEYEFRFSRAEYGIDTAVEYSVDRTAPAPAQNFQVTPGNLKNILTWDTPAEADITRIYLYRSAEDASQPQLLQTFYNRTTVSYTDTNVDDATEYFYWLSYADKYNQESELAGPVSSKPDADTEPPIITHVSPANGSTLSGTASFSVTAQDNKQVKSITMEVSSDGENWETFSTVNTSGTAAFRYDTTGFEGEILYARFRAADIYQNEAYSDAVYRYAVDNTPPAQVTGLWGESTSTTVTLHWKDVPDQDFSYFRVEQQQEDGTFTNVGSVSNTLGMNITGLKPETAYTYRVAAVDTQGNRGEYSESVTITTGKDDAAPVITRITPSPARYNAAIPMSFTVADDYGIRSLRIETSYDAQSWKLDGTVDAASTGRETYLRYELDTTVYREGPLYVRGVAEDLYGNESDRSNDAPFVEYMVDRTAPAAPKDLTAVAVSGVIYLTWMQGTEQDLNGYAVYRATSENGEYTQLTNHLEKLSYTDSRVEKDQTYYYKLTCSDTAGNVSDPCDPVSVMVVSEPDTEAPQIISVSPSDGFILAADTPIRVKVYDNQVVKTLFAAWSADGNTWTDLDPVSVDASTSIVTLPLTGADVSGDTLYLKTHCVDGADLESETVSRAYTIDREAPSAPAVTVTAGELCLNLQWTGSEEADLAGYDLYRRAEGSSDFSRVTGFSANGTGDYSYTDTSVTGDVAYRYYLTAVDQRGNRADGPVSDAVKPINVDREQPIVRASCDQYGTVGIEMQFSAAGTTDNVGIASYLWDFGDGATSRMLEPTHAYSKAGTYTVSLTVTDTSGNSTSGTLTAIIKEQKEISFLEVTVIDENGSRVPSAGVYFNLGSDQQNVVYTDSSGRAQIVAESGLFDVGAYKSGYLPAKTSVKLVKNATTSATLTLVHGDIVVGELTVQRMTLEEIRAANIDVTAPANQEVFQFEITLTYGTEKVKVDAVTNQAGEILKDPDPIYIPGGGGTGGTSKPRVIYPFIIGGGGGGGGGSWGWGGGGSQDVPLIAILDLPGTASWLKDFFDVHLYVLNQADSSFVLDDCSATLNVPSGLTLMDSNRTTSSPTVSMGSIAGQSSATAEWILRGDKGGDYTLSADFNGTLRSFNETIHAVFQTSEPFHVRNGDNLFMDVMVENSILGYTDGAIRIGLRNEDANPYYLPSVNLQKARFVSSFKTRGLTPVETDKEILDPGEEIWFDYIIERADWKTLTENEESDFYLLNQISKTLGGTELQVNFIKVEPYTIAADRVEVFLKDDAGKLSPVQMLNIKKNGLSTGQVPDLVIKTYRLDENGQYVPCAMDITIADGYRMEKLHEEAKVVTTDQNGSYTLEGYEIKQLYNSRTYDMTIAARRAKPVVLPMAIRGATAETGSMEIYVVQNNLGKAKAVPDADVTIDGTTKQTDSKGRVIFKGVDLGYQELLIEKKGYLPISQLVEVASDSELTFYLVKDADPSASRVTGITSSILDATGSNYTILPYGSVEGIVTFNLKSRIADGETFKQYHAVITNASGKQVKHDTFKIESYLLDITELKPGYTLSFAVETDAGESVLTPVDVRVVETPKFFADLFSKLINVGDYWDDSASKEIELTGVEGKTLDLLGDFASVGLLAGVKETEDDDTNDLMDVVKGYSVEKTKEQKLFPLSITYAKDGTLTVSFIFGTETEYGGKKPTSMFSFKDIGKDSTGTAKFTVDFIFSFDVTKNQWKLKIVGTESLEFEFPVFEAPTRIILASVEVEFEEEGKINIYEDHVGPMNETEVLGLFKEKGEGFSVKFGGAVKAALGAKVVSKKIASADAYVKGGIDIIWNKYLKVLLSAEVGHEEQILVWKNNGVIDDWSWEVLTVGNMDLNALNDAVMELTELDEDRTELKIEPTEETGWNNKPGDGVLAEQIYGGCDQQLVTLPDGRSLLVFVDTDPDRDSSNPTVLKYSICKNGSWSKPAAICDDGTVDLYPALTVTDDGAAVVWINLREPLENAETMTLNEIRDAVYSQMDLHVSRFDAARNVWSDPICAAQPGVLSHHPAIGSNGGQTMIAWVQNAAGAEQGSAEAPDQIAYALLSGDNAAETGFVMQEDSAVEDLALSNADDTFRILYKIGDDTNAEMYTLRYSDGAWNDAQRLSYALGESAAFCPMEDGTVSYISGGRLYVRDDKQIRELAQNSLLERVEELNAKTVGNTTYYTWVYTDEVGNSSLCACTATGDGKATTPAVLKTSETMAFGTPAITVSDGQVILLYLSKEYDENYVGVYHLNQMTLVSGYDLTLQQVSEEILYPGAEVTTVYDSINRGLQSETSAELRLSTDPAGENAFTVKRGQPLSGSVTWTVPDSYAGEPIYLIVLPESGADLNAEDNAAAVGRPAADLELLSARYLNLDDTEGKLQFSVRNSGMVDLADVTAIVTDVDTDEVLLSQQLNPLAVGDRREGSLPIHLNPNDCVQIELVSGIGDLQEDNNRITLLVNGTQQQDENGLIFGAPDFRCEDETIRFSRTVSNFGEEQEVVVLLGIYDSIGRQMRTASAKTMLQAGENTLDVSTVLDAYEQREAAFVRALILKADTWLPLTTMEQLDLQKEEPVPAEGEITPDGAGTLQLDGNNLMFSRRMQSTASDAQVQVILSVYDSQGKMLRAAQFPQSVLEGENELTATLELTDAELAAAAAAGATIVRSGTWTPLCDQTAVALQPGN